MPKKYLETLRKFNRAILNPIMMLFAGRLSSYYSLVYHIGRRSGKEYSTPVVAAQKDAYIYIGLPYGSDTDWVLNVKAASKCKVKINGKVYSASNPEIIDPASALLAFSSKYRTSYEKANVKPAQFLKLRKYQHAAQHRLQSDSGSAALRRRVLPEMVHN